MTAEQIDAVQRSWRQVVPMADGVARLFYGRLFALDPSLRRMFRGDMDEQGRKLMATLSFVVDKLGRLPELLPAVQSLGRRHAAYGVRDEHYAKVATALLWTLEQGLGESFTPALREAWSGAYDTLAGAMQEAARHSLAARFP
jgi:hemoglobin-like flavoprotein